MEFPLSYAIKRFSPLPDSQYIFTCDKNGMINIGKESIPLKSLYFMIMYNRSYISFDELDVKNHVRYQEMFVFTTLVSGVPTKSAETYDYKRKVFDYASKNQSLAKTLICTSFTDLELQLEYSPPKENPLSKLLCIPHEYRSQLLLPIQLENDNQNIVLLEDNIVYFSHTVGTYVFMIVDKTIVIRHFVSKDKEPIPNIVLYIEFDFEGKCLSRYDIDEDGYFKLGKHTVYGDNNLMKITNKVFTFDIKKHISILKENNKVFNYSSINFKNSELYKMEKANYDLSDSDDDILTYGIDQTMVSQFQDEYGGYFN